MRDATAIGCSLALAAAALLLGGCEDTGLVASPDGFINLSVTPSRIQIDPNTQAPRPEDLRFVKTASVRAVLFDAGNLPQQGVRVDFFTEGGGQVYTQKNVDPTTGGVSLVTHGTTDASGSVSATLEVTDLDAGELSVVAASGLLSEDFTVTVEVVGINELPRATVTIVPRLEGQVGEIVTFDGSGSLDPDGAITCFQWQLLSDNPDANKPNPFVAQGPGVSGLQLTFSNEQTLGVALFVSDDPRLIEIDPATGRAPCDPAAAPVPQTFFSPFAFFTNYEIRCRNTRPTAVIAGPDTITQTGSASTLTSITLDGTLSSDPETAIDRWVWNCGNGLAPTEVAPDGSIVICRYRPGDYVATLEVVDRGTGVINPSTGTFFCQKFSEPDEVTVRILAP